MNSEANKNSNSQTSNQQNSRILSYDNNEFEMMSIPDGGKDNKIALDNLKKDAPKY